MSLKSWLQEIAGSFQPAATKIRSWKLSPQQEALMNEVWDNLSPTIQKALWAFIALILSKYGPDAAKKILENVMNSINKQGIDLKA